MESYNKTEWIPKVTLVSANNLNKIESKIEELTDSTISVDNNINTLSLEIEEAKTDFNGTSTASLSERITKDIGYVTERFNKAELLEYENDYVIANNSYDGITKDLKIKGQTYKNLLDKNLLKFTSSGDYRGFKIEQLENGAKYTSIDISYASYRTIRFNNLNLIKPNTKYTLFFYVEKDTFNLTKEFTVAGASDCYYGTGINHIAKSTYNVGQNTICFTTHSDISVYTGLGIGFPRHEASSLNGQFIIKNMILLEGDYSDRNVPFFYGIKSVGEEGSFDIVSTNKNVFDLKNTISGFVEWENGIIYGPDCSNRTSRFIRILPSTKYTYISTVNVNCSQHPVSWNAVAWYDKNKKYISRHVKNGVGLGIDTVVYPVNSPANAKYALVGSRYLEDENSQVTFAQGTLSDHVLLTKDSAKITLKEPLRSLPNGVCDEIDFEKGKIIRRIVKYTISGNENWSIQVSNAEKGYTGFLTHGILKYRCKNKYADNIYSSKFISKADWSYVNNIFVDNYQGLGLVIDNSTLESMTTANLKNWLKANPITIYYELETPIEEDIQLSKTLRTFDEITNIFTENSLIEPIISCKVPSNVASVVNDLKEVNSNLTNEVELLAIENNELKDISNKQNEIIDTNLLVLNEIYNTVQPLSINEEDEEKMIKFYSILLKRKLKTIEDIPETYRQAIKNAMGEINHP